MKDRPFRIMRVPALGTKFQFSKQEQLNSLTTYIKENPYAVVLLDEIDALADSKDDLDSSVQDVQSIMDSAINTNVIIIGTTNSDINAKFTTDTPDHKNKPMAPALKSRFQNNIKIDNPTLEHRRAIIKNCLAMLTVKDPHTNVCLTSQDEEALAKRTAGFSIRDMETVFILAHQYVFTSSDSSDEDVSRIKYRQLTNEHIEEAFQAIKKGKRINYMHIAMNCLKNVAIHGPAWINLAHALYSGYIHGLERNEDIKRLDSDRLQHQSELRDDLIRRKEDRIQHLSELSDDLIRNSLIRDSSQAIHESEIATDRYIQAVRRDEDSRWQVIHTGISVAGLLL
jgi:Predicted ATPase (AAA+ superfamily)